MIGTIENLFKEAGFNYKTMEPNVFYPPKKKIKIKSPFGMVPVWNLVYKGDSNNSYKVV